MRPRQFLQRGVSSYTSGQVTSEHRGWHFAPPKCNVPGLHTAKGVGSVLKACSHLCVLPQLRSRLFFLICFLQSSTASCAVTCEMPLQPIGLWCCVDGICLQCGWLGPWMCCTEMNKNLSFTIDLKGCVWNGSALESQLQGVKPERARGESDIRASNISLSIIPE